MKKSLLILQMPRFYGYEKALAEAAAKKYSTVLLITETGFSLLSTAILAKLGALKRLELLREKLLDGRLSKLLTSHEQVDCLAVLGRRVHPSINRLVTASRVNATYYLWDSIDNIKPDEELKRAIFNNDRVVSFDKRDCENFGFTHLPVFTLGPKRDIFSKHFEIVYFASFSEHRVRSVQRFLDVYHLSNISVFYFSTQSWSVFLKNFPAMVEAFLDGLKRKAVFVFLPFSLKQEVYYSLLARAEAVIECRDPNQSSPTQRLADSAKYRLACYDVSELLDRSFFSVWRAGALAESATGILCCADWLECVITKPKPNSVKGLESLCLRS